ncbi:MAG: GxxExxY protein [Alphaproteobacteria bacterium]|nr:GxxExxY protein [Alphaproteobacteria bacterium]
MNHHDTTDTTKGSHAALAAGVDAAARSILDGAFAVHRALGPGLLESVYEACLAVELEQRSIRFERQSAVAIRYRGRLLEPAFRIDLMVDDEVVVEIKAVDRLMPIHEAQVLTYLKLAHKRLGLLINFNVPLLRDGIRRLVL